MAKSWLFLGTLALAIVVAAGCGSPAQPPQTPPAQNVTGEEKEPGPVITPEPGTVSKESSQEIAVDFLRNSPTFKFDGMEDTLKLVGGEAGAIPGAWVFHYEFESRQAGYGDRTGQFLAQVITPHRAEITVEEGKVVSAILDGRWDELEQRTIQ